MMKMGNVTKLVGFLAAVLLLQACASMKGTSSGDRSLTYNKDYNTMVKTVEQAIKGLALEISYAKETENGDKYTIIFNARAYMNSESAQTDQGEVVIERLEKNKTRVVITNPEYHFAVPTHQRKEYDRILKNRIDDLLNV